MHIKPIHNEQDYQETLKRIELLINACPNTEEGDELEILSTLAHAYEEIHDPIEAIQSSMEQMNLKTKDPFGFLKGTVTYSEDLSLISSQEII